MEIDPHHMRSDLRLIERAIKKGWAIPDTALDTLPGMVDQIAKTEAIPIDKRLQAAKVLIAMHGQNLSQQHSSSAPVPQEYHEHQHVHLTTETSESPSVAVDFESKRAELYARISKAAVRSS